ncbi:MAG TPA: DNA translocase FtsK 4TM domain-containing protein, partial [Polyangiaceae bacterium]|nr:DNA translocase FtsK 4TM domain-containing protein [Polyangiaceae bacterium]
MGVRLFSPRQTFEPRPTYEPAPPQAGLPYGRLLETGALLLFAGSLFLTLALLSCRLDPYDPSAHGGDWVGPVGAALASTLVQGFGIVAWLAPVELVLLGAPLFRGRVLDRFGLRVAGDLIVAIVLTALCQVALPDVLVFGNAPIAGNVGLLFGELMRELFSTVGSFLVGPTVIGLILIGRSSFSFIECSQRSARFFRALVARASELWLRLTSSWSQARALRRAERARARALAAPPIQRPDPDAAIEMLLEDDASDWIPLEQTGVPPLALSQALRAARSAPVALAFELSAEPGEEAPPTRRRLSSTPAAAETPESATTPSVSEKRARRSRRNEARTESAVLESAAAIDPTPVDAELEDRRALLARSAEKARSAAKTPTAPVEPEIVDTHHELVVERAPDAVVTRVRDDFRL